MEFDFVKFIILTKFDGSNSSHYADEPLKKFFAEWQQPWSDLMDKRIAEGGYKVTTEEKEVEEKGLTICNGKFTPTVTKKKVIIKRDNRIVGDCINMALYFRDKVNGLLMIGAYGQGHSLVLHLDEDKNVVVTCPYFNTCKGYENYSTPFKDYIKKFPDFRNENVGFAVFRTEGMKESEMTLRDIFDMKYPHISLDLENDENLNKQLDEIRKILIAQQKDLNSNQIDKELEKGDM